MAYSDIEKSYLDTLAQAQFPDLPPEQPMQPPGTQPGDVLMASADTGGISDANPEGLPMEAQTSKGMSVTEYLRGLGDTGALIAKGMVQGFIGTPGDVESLGRGLYSVLTRPEDQGKLDAFFKGLEQKTILFTTEDMKSLFDRYAPLGQEQMLSQEFQQSDMGRKILETGGEIIAPGGYMKAVKPVAGAVVSGAKAVAPYAEKALQALPKDIPVGMSIKAVDGTDGMLTSAPNVVSTRLPTAKKATENPLTDKLTIGLDSAKTDPAAFAHNVELVKQYPNIRVESSDPNVAADQFIDEVKNNLLFLHDAVPAETRQRSKLWYDGARNIATRFSGEYGVPDQAVSGVLAVLSPQKDWFMNVSLGQRVLDIATKQRNARWDSSMDDIAKIIWDKPQYASMVDSIRGKSLDEISDPGLKAMWLRTYDQAKNPREHQIVSPEGDFVGVRMNQDGKTPTKTGWGSLNEIGKAIVILDNPSLETISLNLGDQHKVRNFYNNIYAPNDPGGHVTIDTHAVAAGLMRPLSGNSREVLHNFGSGIKGEGGPKNSSITGVQGTYGLYAEAYRRAAQERGILPREMQSITWEAVRGLFPDRFKTAKNAEQIDSIWLQYRNGDISLDEARNEVFKRAGGINPPEWEGAGLRPESVAPVQSPGNQGELSGASLPGGSAGRSGRVKPASRNSKNVTRGQQPADKGAE